VELSAFVHFNSGNGMGLFPAAEIFLKIENIALRIGHIQSFGVNNSSHDKGFRVGVKLENKFDLRN